MSAPVTLVTVYRTGGPYTARWVRALQRQAARWLPDATFRVLTDAPSEIPDVAIPLRHDWRGVWSLVEWWRPGLFPGRVIAVGLDTLIIGDASPLMACPAMIAGIDDFYHPELLASGVMVWQRDAGHLLYDIFAADPDGVRRRFPRMDPWMRTVIPGAARLQALYPGLITSYKVHAKAGPPSGAAIVCGHGQPKFDAPRAGWAYRHWMEALA